ncbi:MAG: hypothetical protein CMO13_02215 [Thaumarchaeota archaeon]|nr:hypothetical protein [Nitrososphaerota archaeon]
MSIVDGKNIAAEIIENSRIKINYLKNKGIFPCIEILLIGNDEGSEKYVQMKLKKIKEAGANGNIKKIDESKSDEDIIEIIRELNLNRKVNGILVQLPLPDKFNEENILSEIALEKDIDALNPITLKKIDQNNSSYYPAGVDAIMAIFERHKVTINKKNITIIGITNLIGRPLASVLRQKGGIVSEIDVGKHLTLDDLIKTDIIVTDIGKPEWLKKEMVKDQVTIIDAANNYVNGKLLGDVDMNGMINKVNIITPVPGGVGPILIASLIENLIKSAELSDFV